MLRPLLLDAALHAAEGSVHALDEAVLDLLVVLLHLQVSAGISKHVPHSWATVKNPKFLGPLQKASEQTLTWKMS